MSQLAVVICWFIVTIQAVTLRSISKISIPIHITNHPCPPLLVSSTAPLRTLYNQTIDAKCLNISNQSAPNGISIIFRDMVLANLRRDFRLISDIGINAKHNEIQVISKPVVVCLLEMILGISNRERIPWFEHAISCVSAPSSNHNTVCSNSGLSYDSNGTLIGINLSNLGLIGDLNIGSLPHTVRSLDISSNDLNTFQLHGFGGKSLEILRVQNNNKWIIERRLFGEDIPLKSLYVSSDQIFPWITTLNSKKRRRITRWMNTMPFLERMIVDNDVEIKSEIRTL